jgi:type II secretory ATPase GspE/PulE/Tfp pilus assembly ATPase PilB-like protein
MPICPALRTAIADGRTTAELRKISAGEGMLRFHQAALLKVANGQTSTDEVFRAIPAEQLAEFDE